MTALLQTPPQKLTKVLKLKTVGDIKKVCISSKHLDQMGWRKDDRLRYENKNGGISLTHDFFGQVKVHTRRYKSRPNTPPETLIELSSQDLISKSLGVCNTFHATITERELFIRGVPNRAANIIKSFRASRKMTAIAAMSGGLDLIGLEANGFSIEGLIEYRPQEKRDTTDKTEVPSIMASVLASPKRIYNESIYTMDMTQLEEILSNSPVMLMHLSPVCKQFTLAASKLAKQEKINNLESTLDMIIPCLDAVKTVNPPAIMIENVVPFFSSEAYDILALQLRRLGYYLTPVIHDPTEHGGLSTRKRAYVIASVFPGYELPTELIVRNDLWDVVQKHMPDCKDVTNLVSVKKSFETGRARLITKDSKFSPTILACQSRGTKDAVRIQTEKGVFNPSLGLCAEIMGVKNFPENILTSESSYEILGNGVDVPSHTLLVQSVVKHLEENTGGKPLIKCHQGI